MRRCSRRVVAVKLFICWMFIFCFSHCAAVAQQNTGVGAPDSTVSVPNAAANHLITLDVVVANPSGQLIPGLQQQDFTVLDDNQPRKIISFQAVEASAATVGAPAEVILVLDQVNTSYRNIIIARQEIERFLSHSPGELPWPVSIIFFTDSGATGTTPSRDAKTVIKNLKENEHPLPNGKRSQGIYGAVERLNLSLRTLGQLVEYEAHRPGRKLVIWFGSGWTFLSTPRVDLTSKDQDGMFRTIVSLSGSLRRARLTLYNVDPSGSGSVTRGYYKSFVKGVTAARQVQGGELGLQVLAYQSGGLVLNSSNDLAAEIATCVADASSFYVLSFDGAVGDGPNEYHALEVKTDKVGLNARARSGYYAQPAQVSVP